MHPSLKHSLQEWGSQSLYNKPDFVFPSERLQGSKPLDLASVLKKKIQPAFRRIGITGVGWHTFRHSVGTMLAEMGEHQLTIRDYLPAQQPSNERFLEPFSADHSRSVLIVP
jgi:integrase